LGRGFSKQNREGDGDVGEIVNPHATYEQKVRCDQGQQLRQDRPIRKEERKCGSNEEGGRAVFVDIKGTRLEGLSKLDFTCTSLKVETGGGKNGFVNVS